MNVWFLYCFFMTLLFLMGVRALIRGRPKGFLPVYDRRGLRYQCYRLWEDLQDRNVDPRLQRMGLPISMRRYQAVRKLILACSLAVGVGVAVQGQLGFAKRWWLIGILLYLIPTPKDSIGSKRTVFFTIGQWMGKRRKEQMDLELAAIIMQMRNLILSRNFDFSADYVITRLLPFMHHTRPVFQVTLSYIRQGRVKEAGAYLEERFGTKLGSDFARILVKLDELSAKEFLVRLSNVQQAAMEQKRTREEMRSAQAQNIKVSLAFLEAVLIMGNFIYLILMDTLQTMSFLV